MLLGSGGRESELREDLDNEKSWFSVMCEFGESCGRTCVCPFVQPVCWQIPESFVSVLQLFEQEVLPRTRWFLGRSHGATSVQFGEVFERDCTANISCHKHGGKNCMQFRRRNGERMLVWWFLLSIFLYVLTRETIQRNQMMYSSILQIAPALEMVATILFVEGILAQNKNQHNVCSIILPFSPSYSHRSKENDHKTTTMFHNFSPKKTL